MECDRCGKKIKFNDIQFISDPPNGLNLVDEHTDCAGDAAHDAAVEAASESTGYDYKKKALIIARHMREYRR